MLFAFLMNNIEGRKAGGDREGEEVTVEPIEDMDTDKKKDSKDKDSDEKLEFEEDDDMYVDPDSIPNEDEYIDEEAEETEEPKKDDKDGMQQEETSAQSYGNIINEEGLPEVTMYVPNRD
jgi:hypothetical protein